VIRRFLRIRSLSEKEKYSMLGAQFSLNLVHARSAGNYSMATSHRLAKNTTTETAINVLNVIRFLVSIILNKDLKCFTTDDKKIVCNECWTNDLAPNCTICKKKIIGKRATANGGKLVAHTDCFTCGTCKLEIGESEYMAEGNSFVHILCLYK